jgi:hypothetical protein
VGVLGRRAITDAVTIAIAIALLTLLVLVQDEKKGSARSPESSRMLLSVRAALLQCAA